MEAILQKIGANAKRATQALARLDSDKKNTAIRHVAEALIKNSDYIIKQNNLDINHAEDRKLPEAMIDRLLLNTKTIEGMASSLITIAEMEDPVGVTLDSWARPNGIKISRVSVPLGVIGIIYESRPNVTSDAGILCLKSGNAVILRGGSEAVHSNLAIHEVMIGALTKSNITEHAIQFIPTQDRLAVDFMLKDMTQYIDVIIPRGGKSLIASVSQNARVPVMGHLEGICHTYVHLDAELNMAASIVLNAKMRRTGICGATETVLLHRDILMSHGPTIIKALHDKGCEIRGDRAICGISEHVIPAQDSDWGQEFLSSIIAIRIVDSIDEAIQFITEYGSGHTECIISESKEAADQFFYGIDSAILTHNVSTQFADGGEFGLGAEIGIATGKIHARGPVGAAQLVSYKYILQGSGQIRP